MAVEVQGFAEFRRLLKAVDPQWAKELSKANRVVAKRVALKARSYANAYGPMQRASSGAIKWSGTQAAASVKVADTTRNPFALPAFWGAKKRTGWNAGNVRPNLPEWVGNGWDYGVHGQGPYAINDAVADAIPEVLDDYMAMLDELFSKAFPHH